MKISTNSIGNYNPIRTNQNANINKVEIKKNEDSLKVTNEEKNFFTELYPENKEQIDGYHFYNKEGDKKGVSLGSLFDKRG
jgi:hypothetical protein